ncbi:hypothetical protein M9H77_18143 [Catharanthus roseus]|uniref:Uncharacterized protein n=1 Tax=Catharanthus roseus TaxID=4058 RepID=A0ACC0B6M3_CATRO|nr:hypothetical protein M9H77_18143 [Catharanthus roseus]
MDHFEDYLQENNVFEDDVDPNTFEEFLESEEYLDHGPLFTTDGIFNSKVELVDWTKEMAMKANTYLIITRHLKSRISARRPYVILYTKIYNVIAKIKKNRMQGQNTIEKVLCLSAEWGYAVFYINCEDSNLKAIGMTPTGKNFIVATAFIRNEQATTYRWKTHRSECIGKLTKMVKDKEVATRFVNGSWRTLINEIDEVEYHRKLDVLKTMWQRRPNLLYYLFNTWLNPLAHKFCRVWTSEVLHFRVNTMNRVESKHSVLTLWLSTCHSDLDTVFFNIDFFIESQIAKIKSSLDISKLKEKFYAKSNPILKNISNNISHLALKKIWLEIKRASEIVDDPQNKYGHYLRKSHGLPSTCDLVARYEHLLPLHSEDVSVFWRTLEIRVDIPSAHAWDMDSEICDLASMLDQISTGPISKDRECHLIKGVLSPVLPEDPSALLTSPPEHVVTKGRRKTNSTKRDKSYLEHVFIAHRKIGKSSGFRSSSGSGSGSGSGSSSHERDRPPSVPRGRVEDVAVDEGPPPYYLCIRIELVLRECCASATSRNKGISYSYKCEMDTHCLLCTCNGNIIVIFESATGQSLILNGYQIGLGDLIQKFHPKILFM